MISSMTGYGRAEVTAPAGRFAVEIKSVNKKSLDVSVSLPKELAALEPGIRRLVSRRLSRGRVSVSVTHEGTGKLSDYMVVDEGLAEEYCDLLRKLKRRLGLKGDIDLGMILSAREIVKFRRPDPDVDECWKAVGRALRAAIKDLIGMRRAEGEAICADIEARRKKLDAAVGKIGRLAPAVMKKYRASLLKRLRSTGKDVALDEGRLLGELAVFADRSDISEELTRLGSHLNQFEKLLSGGRPVGRTLDFLIQEIYREINTVGSKANSAEISREAVYFKTELEKIREQVQNIE
ncbi:MAG: YicC/YloC family endoribonuclease [Candidatus Tritonobacter lacicola]|nr:YicC/YloC family endoribonuclease [Candidatus Tritonobacter lacicola]